MGFFECWLHFVIIGSIVVYSILQLAFYSLFSSKKKEVSKETKNRFVRWIKSLSNANIAFVSNIVFHLILWIIFVAIPHCWFCTLLLVLYFIWIVITILIIFFRTKILNFLLKKLRKGKKTQKKAKLISKLTNWKNELEFEESAITLNDAFNLAPALSSKKNFDITAINKSVEEFGSVEIKQDENVGGNKMINDCWKYYATIVDQKDKIVKDCFAYLFDLRKNNGKNKAAVLLLKIEPRSRKELFRFFPKAAVSKFPLGRDYIAFPVTDTVSADSCVIYLHQAYEFTTKCLEEKEFNKMSKKIKM